MLKKFQENFLFADLLALFFPTFPGEVFASLLIRELGNEFFFASLVKN